MRFLICTVVCLLAFNFNSYAGETSIPNDQSSLICTGTSSNKKIMYAVSINGNRGKLISNEKKEGLVEYFNLAVALADYRIFLQTDENVDGIFAGHKLLVYDSLIPPKITVLKMTEFENKIISDLTCVLGK
ncbi:MAG: hypothetical protein ACXVCU_04005 [Bdellovibrio sp.]